MIYILLLVYCTYIYLYLYLYIRPYNRIYLFNVEKCNYYFLQNIHTDVYSSLYIFIFLYFLFSFFRF